MITQATQDELNKVLASDPAAIADPFPLWKQLRAETRVYRDGPRVIFTRHADVKELLSDSSDRYGLKWRDSEMAIAVRATLPPDQQAAWDRLYGLQALFMQANTGEEHDRMRRVAHRVFTPRRVRDLHNAAEAFTEELIDELLERGEVVDLMDLAYRLPLMMIVDLLNCPMEDMAQIHAWSTAIGAGLDRVGAESILAAGRAVEEFGDYVEEIVAGHRTGEHRRELVEALLGAEDDERLTHEELTAMFVLLLFAGHETTTNLLAHGVHALLTQRDQWDLLVADPDRAPAVVEEVLRWASPVQATLRFAAEQHEFAGERIVPGDMLIALLASANRDERVFHEPETFDIARSDARDHVSFGFGPKFCLGHALARLEGDVVFRALATRFPDIELATDSFEYTSTWALRRLTALPVRLGADHGGK